MVLADWYGTKASVQLWLLDCHVGVCDALYKTQASKTHTVPIQALHVRNCCIYMYYDPIQTNFNLIKQKHQSTYI